MNVTSAAAPYSVATHARAVPDRAAVVMGGSGEAVTYGELDERSARLARLLRASGCHPGDHIAVLLENHPRFAEVCWAAHRSGLHYTPVNWHLTPVEAAYVVNDCGATVVISSHAQRAVAGELPDRCPGVRRWLMIDGAPEPFESYETALAGQPAQPLADETEGSAMLYSSGTTGRPKGVERPLSSLAPGARLFGVDPAVAAAYGIDADTVSLVPLPMYHSSGLTRLMLCTSIGCTSVVMERFDAEAALALIEHHRVSVATFVPTMLIRMLGLDPAVRARYDLSSLRSTNVGSGPCPAWVKEAIIEWWGPILVESYGGTEGVGMTSITSPEALTRPGSVGRVVFGELYVMRPDRSEAAPGEPGVVYFGGGRPFEYHNDPDKTAEVRDEQGRTTLGDVGYVDQDGYLFLVDRVADVIISGAVNIYPREVEDVLLQHPDVQDAAVIGVPNDEFGEEVKAVVVPRQGVVADAALAVRLIDHCRAALAGFKCPRSVDFTAELPRQATGKLAKRLVREPYWRDRTSRIV